MKNMFVLGIDMFFDRRHHKEHNKTMKQYIDSKCLEPEGNDED